MVKLVIDVRRLSDSTLLDGADTEIDWLAYMSEVEGFLGGELDYTKLKGASLSLLLSLSLSLYIYLSIYLSIIVVIIIIIIKTRL